MGKSNTIVIKSVNQAGKMALKEGETHLIIDKVRHHKLKVLAVTEGKQLQEMTVIAIDLLLTLKGQQ